MLKPMAPNAANGAALTTIWMIPKKIFEMVSSTWPMRAPVSPSRTQTTPVNIAMTRVCRISPLASGAKKLTETIFIT